MPDTDFDWAQRWTANAASTITKRGYQSVGTLSELTQAARRPGVNTDEASPDAQLAIAVDGMASLARYVAADTESHSPQTIAVLQTQMRRSRGVVLPEIRQAITGRSPSEFLQRVLATPTIRAASQRATGLVRGTSRRRGTPG